MKLEEMKAMNSEELAKKLAATRDEYFNLKLRLSTKQLVNHREIPRTKRNIARMETILRERALQAQQVK
jgi:large subunit ribosomal protein L29